LVERRNIAVDVDLAEAVKKIAAKRGATLAGFLRRILRLIVELDSRGVDPVGVLENAYFYETLASLGAIPLPAAVLTCTEKKCMIESLREFFAGLREFGVDGASLVKFLARALGAAVTGQRVLAPSNSHTAFVLEAVAKAYGLNARRSGAYLVVELGGLEA